MIRYTLASSVYLTKPVECLPTTLLKIIKGTHVWNVISDIHCIYVTFYAFCMPVLYCISGVISNG